MTTLTTSSEVVATESLASEPTVRMISWTRSGGAPAQFIMQLLAEAVISAALQRDPRQPAVSTARQQWLRMKERARQRTASAPSYPDHPDDLAEQEVITRALAPGQARAQAQS